METIVRKLRKFENYLDEVLKDPVEAANYLNAAYKEDEETFLLALQDVARARGVSAVAKATGLQREGLYKMLSKKGNPQYRSLLAVLDSMHLGIQIVPKAA
jgi:probable addiction module antidote protein